MTGSISRSADAPARPEDGSRIASGRPGVSDAQLDAAAQTFDLLSVAGRLHLVWLLAGDEVDVGTLAAATGASLTATSQQLAKLRAAGVVSARRDGRRQLYRVDDPHIVSVLEHMFEHIAPDGTLRREPDQRRPPRRPRFVEQSAAQSSSA